MTVIDSILGQPAAHAIGWALLQFVWQGALIGGLTFLVLLALRRSAADVRYVVASIGLAVMLTMPAVTALQTWRATTVEQRLREKIDETIDMSATLRLLAGENRRREWLSWPDPAAAGSIRPAGNGTSAVPHSNFGRIMGGVPPAKSAASLSPSPSRPMLRAVWTRVAVIVWFTGVLALSLRLLAGWFIVRRMATLGATDAPPEWRQLVARLARQLHISRPIRLLQSALVEVPTVIGWVRPVVLVPVSALAGMAPSQLEAILAHELAHVRRHDYLVNLLQTVVETLLFYHPAVWWLSRRIRIERENCCDDLAVSLCGDPYAYAQALADLEERRGSVFALAASGGSLVGRVRRLLTAPAYPSRGGGWLAGSAAVAVIAGLAAAVIGINVVDARMQRAVLPGATNVGSGQSTSAAAQSTPRTSPAASETLASQRTTPPPAPPAPPAPPGRAPAPPPSLDSGNGRTTMSWSDSKRRMELRFEGVVTFSDDDRDVKALSPGGMFRLREGGWLSSRTIELTADASGAIHRRYWAGMSEKDFEPEGRLWLAEALPQIIRQSGIAAKARVARIYKAQGAKGVLAEIDLINGSFGKRVYFSELLNTPGVDAQATAPALAQAGSQIDSDFELATLLVDAGQRFLADDGVRRAYVEAARSIGSDFEMRRALSAPVDTGRMNTAVLASLLDVSSGIDSDFELASLLENVAQRYPLDDVRAPFFKAVSTIASSFEHSRVIKAVARRGDLAPETIIETLRSAEQIDSEFECAQALKAIVSQRQLTGDARDLYIRIAGRFGDFEEGQAMTALVKSERRD